MRLLKVATSVGVVLGSRAAMYDVDVGDLVDNFDDRHFVMTSLRMGDVDVLCNL